MQREDVAPVCCLHGATFSQYPLHEICCISCWGEQSSLLFFLQSCTWNNFWPAASAGDILALARPFFIGICIIASTLLIGFWVTWEAFCHANWRRRKWKQWTTRERIINYKMHSRRPQWDNALAIIYFTYTLSSTVPCGSRSLSPAARDCFICTHNQKEHTYTQKTVFATDVRLENARAYCLKADHGVCVGVLHLELMRFVWKRDTLITQITNMC